VSMSVEQEGADQRFHICNVWDGATVAGEK
jgi:hypothetical protein